MLIRIVDIETLGLEAADGVCEVGICDLYDDEVCHLWSQLVDAGKPIPPQMSAVHHICDQDVIGARSFEQIVNEMLDPEDGEIDAYCAHNNRFERVFITSDMTAGKPWIDTYRCALRLWPNAPAHTNQTLRYWMRPAGLDRSIAALSHRAGPDAYVTAFLLREMLRQESFDQLLAWSSEPALLVKVGFGKHFGLRWDEVPSGYLEWVAKQDMDEDVLFTANHYLRIKDAR